MNVFYKIKELCFESPQIGNKRDNTLDEITGWLIVRMILLHAGILDYHEHGLGHCFFFLMPWLFCKSGMYARDRSFAETIRRESKRLLIPYFFFSLFALITTTVVVIPNGISECLSALGNNACLIVKQTLLTGTSWLNYPLWFLTTLFVCKCISTLVQSRYRWLLCVVAIIVAFLHNRFMVSAADYSQKYIYIGNVALALFYYNLGAIVRGKQFNKILFAVCAVVYIAMFIFVPTYIDCMQNHLYYGYYWLGVLGTICGIVAINNAVRYLPVFKPFTYIGRNSIALYVTHWPLLFLFLHYYPNNMAFLALFVIISPLLIYISRKCPFVFGK